MKSFQGPCCTRRHVLSRGAYGLGSLALAWLLDRDGLLAAEARPELEQRTFDLTPKPAHFPPRTRAMISMFMQGGPSQMDLFDPKPKLMKMSGENYPDDDIKYDDVAAATRTILGPIAEFNHHGQSGIEVSDLLPGLGGIVDDITLIRSMHTGVNNHEQAICALQNGHILAGRPVLGSWLAYGLGSENQDLPAFLALTDPRGLPVLAVQNWSNGWLPSIYQGTAVRPREPRM
jgi:hypothetical protein